MTLSPDFLRLTRHVVMPCPRFAIGGAATPSQAGFPPAKCCALLGALTVRSSARIRQMSCLHEQMTGSEWPKGTPVYEQEIARAISRSSGEHEVQLHE